MKVKVDENVCVGTGNCELACPAVFKVVNGVSKVQVEVVPKGEEANAREAVDGCPVSAIRAT